jgi:HD-like signal output (HDOD) protein
VDAESPSPDSPESPALTAAPPRLADRLRDLEAWVRHFAAADWPVLGRSADALEDLREHEDDVDAHLIAETFGGDPLMTLKVLAYAATHRPSRLITDTETMTATVLMMGIGPFFRSFGPQRRIEQDLADLPEALVGLEAVLRRAHRAADFALGFAVHRMDHDAAVIQEAALLHDFAEMLLWCHAPTLALQIRAAQAADPALRSATIQQRVLGIQLADLQQALMKTWRLPELLVQIMDDRQAAHPRVRSVVLAVRVARHLASGWDNAALPDDVADIAQLLNLSPGATLKLLRDIDA